jgi:hypothetical protein
MPLSSLTFSFQAAWAWVELLEVASYAALVGLVLVEGALGALVLEVGALYLAVCVGGDQVLTLVAAFSLCGTLRRNREMGANGLLK